MPKTRIGLSMLFCLGAPFFSLMKRLNTIDVFHVELLDEGLHTLNGRRVKALKKVARSRGLELSLHSPFADINIASPSPVLRRTILKRQEKSIFYASQLGCRLWVFHPGLKTAVSPFYPGLEWRLNLDSVHTLLGIAKKHGVEIAIENVPEPYPFLMKSVQDFSRFYNELDEDLGLVFDIGHANVNRQTEDFIVRFSDKIVHIHASDNDGVGDQHLGIGYGTIDWNGVAKALEKVKYNGLIILESVEHVEESLQKLQKLFT
ncbi:sugar phosphate isomerase/epimerase [Candidatus Bathyarchaeota archaeon]|nr:MAG: sugar phosphate isomerase/epimerase [Candidatus Bathyarchaeota archaeon]